MESSVECEDIYEEKCHTTFLTKYETATVERCREEFVKECRIEFEPDAQNITQMICKKPLTIENCNANEELDGQDVVCVTRYETECIRGKHQVSIELNVSLIITIL